MIQDESWKTDIQKATKYNDNGININVQVKRSKKCKYEKGGTHGLFIIIYSNTFQFKKNYIRLIQEHSI